MALALLLIEDIGAQLVRRIGLPRHAETLTSGPRVIDLLPIQVGCLDEGSAVLAPIPTGPKEPQLVPHDRTANGGIQIEDLLERVASLEARGLQFQGQIGA